MDKLKRRWGFMYRLDGAVHILVDLPAGLYQFGPQGSTGKSYLYRYLFQRKNAGDKVYAYTYGQHPIKELLAINPADHSDCIILDRATLYAEEPGVFEWVLEASKVATVLMDIKTLHSKLSRYATVVTIRKQGLNVNRTSTI